MKSEVNDSKFIITTNQNKSFNFGEEQKSKVYDLYVYIWYKCEESEENNYNCSLENSDKNESLSFYIFYLNYTGYKTVHQNKDLPLQKYYMSVYFYFSNDEKIFMFFQKWKTIKYIENINEYYGGMIINDKMAIIDMPENLKLSYKKGLRLLCCIKIDYIWVNYFDIYTRSKKTIIDEFSFIFSAAITIYNGFIFFIVYYIQKIMTITKLLKKF